MAIGIFGYYVDYCRKKCEKDPRVYPEPIKRGFGIRPNDTKRVY